MNTLTLTYGIPYFIAAILSVAIALRVWGHRTIQGAIAFIFVSLGVVIWSAGAGIELLNRSLTAKLFWSDIQVIGIVILPVAWLIFALQYTHTSPWLSRRLWLLLLVEPVVTIALVWTHPLRSLYFQNAWLSYSGPFPVANYSFGTWFWVHFIYSYLLFLAGAVLLILNLARTTYVNRTQFFVLLFSALLPLVFDVLDSAQLVPFPKQELTPLAFVFTEIAFGMGVFRFRFQDILPVARGALIENINDGVIVLDLQDRVVDMNPAARRILRHKGSITQPIAQLLPAVSPLILNDRRAEDTWLEMQIGEAEAQRHYELRVSPIYLHPGKLSGRLIVLHDISEHRRLQAALQSSEEKYRNVVERSNDGILVVQDELIRYCNPQLAEMLGATVEKLLDEPFYELFGRSDRAEIIDRYRKRLSGEPVPNRYEYTMYRRDGMPLEVEINAGVMQFEGRPATLGIIRDISQRKRSEQALRQANDRLTSSVSELRRHNRTITLLSQMGSQLQSCASVEDAYIVIGEYSYHLFPGLSGALYILNQEDNTLESAAVWGDLQPVSRSFAPGDCFALADDRRLALNGPAKGKRCAHVEAVPEGRDLPYVCLPMIVQDELIGLFHLIGKGLSHRTDLDELASTVAEHAAISLASLRLREKLRSQSIHDMLTGLYNRRYLQEALEKELHRAARFHHQVGLIMLDIDDFKNYNDTHGHEAGDILLQAMARFLEQNTRSEDVVCRYGGDELVVIMPEVSLEDASHRAEELRGQATELLVDFNGQSLGPLTISLGVASFPEHGQTAETLLRAVDAALYEAKERGRNMVAVAK
jgi:diguanylate cyclase (GGDEF)-like protein/PAS domain S-box-containing protein